MDKISSVLGMGGSDSGDKAADAAIAGSELDAKYKERALDYLIETEALPKQFREAALKRQAGMAGLEGGEGGEFDQQGMIDRAMESPLYTSLLEGGNEAAMAKRSMTGGLRGGGMMSDLQSVQNDALLTSYNQQYNQEMGGLNAMAGLPSMAPMIANQTSAIGQTLGQGQIAAAQARMAGNSANTGNMMGMANLGLQAYGAFSDIRLKKNIKKVGYDNGHNIYSWDWNADAEQLGLTGESAGVMAHEVFEKMPEAVSEYQGYIVVDYAQLMLKEAA